VTNKYHMMFNQIQQQLQIGGYINFQSNILGLDSYEHCLSKKIYQNFTHKVDYQFNQLGYRDRNVNEYQTNAVIVIGDSFTVGLGLPVQLTYPAQLEPLIKHQVLNFGLNGASNDWMARKLAVILKYFTPRAVIIHYTFSHRREKNEPNWFDNERTLCDPLPNHDENYLNWLQAHARIQTALGNIPAIYSHIPGWHPGNNSVKQVDLARDGFHYGVVTCANLAEEYADYINQL
jgi:hypothetical protein